MHFCDWHVIEPWMRPTLYTRQGCSPLSTEYGNGEIARGTLVRLGPNMWGVRLTRFQIQPVLTLQTLYVTGTLHQCPLLNTKRQPLMSTWITQSSIFNGNYVKLKGHLNPLTLEAPKDFLGQKILQKIMKFARFPEKKKSGKLQNL